MLQAPQQNWVGEPRDQGIQRRMPCWTTACCGCCCYCCCCRWCCWCCCCCWCCWCCCCETCRIRCRVASFAFPVLPFFLPFSLFSVTLPTGSLRPSFRRGPGRPLAWLLARFCPLSTRIHHALCHHVMCLFDTWHSSGSEFTSSSCSPWAFTSPSWAFTFLSRLLFPRSFSHQISSFQRSHWPFPQD